MTLYETLRSIALHAGALADALASSPDDAPLPGTDPPATIPPAPTGYDLATHGALVEGFDKTPDPAGTPAWVIQGGPIGIGNLYDPPHWLTRGNHAVRWLAGVKIATAGTYEFRLAVKCTGYLWLNGEPCWEQQRLGNVQGDYIVTEFSRELPAGVAAVEACLSNQNTAGEGYELRWRGPGILVPADSPDGYAAISTAVIFPPADWRTRLKAPVAPPPVIPGPQPESDLILPPLIGTDYQTPDLPADFMDAELFKPWREDISAKPVDPKSAAYLASLGSFHLHPGFGQGNNGIPIQWASSTPSNETEVTFDVPDESDKGPWEIPVVPVVEGSGDPSKGDVHWCQPDTHVLDEIYQLHQRKDGKWYGYSGAHWLLQLPWDQRPAGWTSADAAGLPITPGLVRYQEVATGEINHALRCTVGRTQKGYCGYARHWASTSDDPNLLPMGAMIRLKASVDISGFPPDVQVILRCLKKHGMVVADNGSAGVLFLIGTPDKRWDDSTLAAMKVLRQDSFEIVETGPIAK